MLIKALGVAHTFKESEFFMVRCKCCQKPIMHYDHNSAYNYVVCDCGHRFDLNRMLQPVDLYGRWFFKINEWRLKDQYDVITKDGRVRYNVKPNYIYYRTEKGEDLTEDEIMFMRLVIDDRVVASLTGQLRIDRNKQMYGRNAPAKSECFYEGSLLVLEL